MFKLCAAMIGYGFLLLLDNPRYATGYEPTKKSRYVIGIWTGTTLWTPETPEGTWQSLSQVMRQPWHLKALPTDTST